MLLGNTGSLRIVFVWDDGVPILESFSFAYQNTLNVLAKAKYVEVEKVIKPCLMESGLGGNRS